MNLTDLIKNKNIDPRNVLVLRHRPWEPELNKVLPWLAAERPDLFNAYQQTQGDRLEGVMKSLSGVGYVASFLGTEAGKALFVGLYSIGESRPLTYDQYWRIPFFEELKRYGMEGFNGEKRKSILWFELDPSELYSDWKGKLVVKWSPPERSWWRRCHRNDFPVLAIHEESVLSAALPQWDDINLRWEQLCILPTSWRVALSQWRGIYYIFDTQQAKGYVGSAYGRNNLLGRWQDYASRGHGGNRLLKACDPRNLCFTILQLVSPTMSDDDVIRLESKWKERLHSREHGLNAN